MAIGLSVVARVPRSRGVIAAVAIWFVMMLIPLYQALST
jgi:hypothetical protein